LKVVWEGKTLLNTIRKGLPDNLDGICANCLMRNRCFGACIAQNYYRTGELWAPFWFCEEAEKTGLFPSSRKYKMPDSCCP
jgi:radical SAM protein with 4Fe4S-binding SPASM domain